VYIKALKDEILDQILVDISSPLYVIGASGCSTVYVLTLFDKQDVIVNRIEKLPVLRGADIKLDINPATFDRMVASALETINVQVRVWNGAVSRNELLAFKNAYVSVMGGTTMIHIDEIGGGVELTALLTNELTITIGVGADDLVAGLDFPAGYLKASVMLEMDWVKITDDELKTYAVEQLYTEMP
jgi:hypothetical protein